MTIISRFNDTPTTKGEKKGGNLAHETFFLVKTTRNKNHEEEFYSVVRVNSIAFGMAHALHVAVFKGFVYLF